MYVQKPKGIFPCFEDKAIRNRVFPRKCISINILFENNLKTQFLSEISCKILLFRYEIIFIA